MKLTIIERAALCALCLVFLFSAVVFSAESEAVSQKVLRLHVLANSDSQEDQELKLLVRDRLLEEGAMLFSKVDSKEEAMTKTEKHIAQLEKAAESCVKENGFSYSVKIKTEKTYFPTKTYGKIALPAGMYDAVRVEIGKAEGQNWWCVIFPALCLPTAEKEDLEGVLNKNEMDFVEQEGAYKLGFKTVELIAVFRNWLYGKE